MCVSMESTRLPDYIEKVAVSSVLNRDTKQYGKNNLFDGNPETCWNSDSGAVQWISVKFREPLQLEMVCIQFQGGFAAEKVVLQLWNEDKSSKTSTAFYPVNTNSVQSFIISNDDAFLNCSLLFSKPFDFFGRIIVYTLDFKHV
uniref:Nuclear receptor 2C2-associated protein n=2 Tax=Schistocephalus solidus TaxID=70667 RepID=A0A0X3PKP8_SCHSO